MAGSPATNRPLQEVHMGDTRVESFERLLQKQGTGTSLSCNVPSKARDYLDLEIEDPVTVHLDKENEIIVIEPAGEDGDG